MSKDVGAIRPAPDDGEPLFRIIRREQGTIAPTGDENVRPCDHMGFTLDERWHTVTCKICKQPVDAFAVLMLYAGWYERLRRERSNTLHAERGLHIARLHKLKNRRALTVEERNDVLKAIRDQYAMKAKDVAEVANRTEKILRQRKNLARAARRQA